MPRLEFSELPQGLRVKLSQQGQEELWHRVEEFGGVKSMAEAFGYSSSKIYNWKSKDLAIPIKFVKQIMGENNTEEIILLKGEGSSSKIDEPNFPLSISEELLTRVDISVKQNSEGTPTYLSEEKALVERFAELLENLGEVECQIYSRESRYELRYPKFLNEIFSQIEFDRDLSALVDEKAEIKNGRIILQDKEISVGDFDEKLFSREKKFELALEKGDSSKIAELMAKESSKVRSMLGI